MLLEDEYKLDKLRLITALLFLIGSLFSVIIAIRIFDKYKDIVVE